MKIRQGLSIINNLTLFAPHLWGSNKVERNKGKNIMILRAGEIAYDTVHNVRRTNEVFLLNW